MKQLIKRKACAIVKKSYWYNEVIFKDCRKFWNLNPGDKFDVINLGSSSGTYDFDYRGLDVKGMSWAIAPQSTIGDFIILKQFRPYLKDNGIVLYPLCPFTAISGGIDYLEDRCYSFLNFENVPDASYIRMSKVLFQKNYPLSTYPVFELLRAAKHFILGSKPPVLTEEQLKTEAARMMDRWMKQFNIKNMDDEIIKYHQDVFDKTIVRLNEIVEYCAKEHLKLFLIIPPVYHTLAEWFTPNSKRQLFDMIVSDAVRKGIPFLNFMEEHSFTNDRTLFRSSYYFNEKGAQKFTKFILDKINNSENA